MPPPTRHKHDRFHEELPQDVVAAGADGHPQADLPRPLRHRDEHDVHDPHAAHDQRDGGHDQAAGCPSSRDVGGHGLGRFRSCRGC